MKSCRKSPAEQAIDEAIRKAFRRLTQDGALLVVVGVGLVVVTSSHKAIACRVRDSRNRRLMRIDRERIHLVAYLKTPVDEAYTDNDAYARKPTLHLPYRFFMPMEADADPTGALSSVSIDRLSYRSGWK